MRSTWATGPSSHNERPWYEELDEPPVEPVETFYRRQVEERRSRLDQDPPTDPTLRARLERDLELVQRELDRCSLEDHWIRGVGDRRLF